MGLNHLEHSHSGARESSRQNTENSATRKTTFDSVGGLAQELIKQLQLPSNQLWNRIPFHCPFLPNPDDPNHSLHTT
jgi:hypothetical protein